MNFSADAGSFSEDEFSSSSSSDTVAAPRDVRTACWPSMLFLLLLKLLEDYSSTSACLKLVEREGKAVMHVMDHCPPELLEGT